MTTIAIISDVHANLEALEAVLADIDSQTDISAVYCLGDLVGYGPDPGAVIDIVEARCAWSLMGNHDYAMLHSPEGFTDIAAGAIQCQRRELGPDAEESRPGIFVDFERLRRWEFLRKMKSQVEHDDVLYVHASPRNRFFEYLSPDDSVQDPDKLIANFERVKWCCFVGHTHRPGIFTDDLRFHMPQDIGMKYLRPSSARCIVNVGSVGQPRDGDPRACYVTVSEGLIQWRRVEYDIETTVAKVKANPCLDDKCGFRLLEGR
jgi:diadenosine tetraphosphatase ApaH/serine/threonine PP2A family protein phosphatase